MLLEINSSTNSPRANNSCNKNRILCTENKVEHVCIFFCYRYNNFTLGARSILNLLYSLFIRSMLHCFTFSFLSALSWSVFSLSAAALSPELSVWVSFEETSGKSASLYRNGKILVRIYKIFKNYEIINIWLLLTWKYTTFLQYSRL